jgi:beta-lactamase superfamily II metal-dependent hydrolase
MKLTIYQSSSGDCLLLESQAGKRILCDGGMAPAMREFVAPALGRLRAAEPKRPIDVLYVSHVDMDHIGGVLTLLQNAVEWRVFDAHGGAAGFGRPDVPRPPEILNIWHNAFGDQVTDNVGPIEDALAMSSQSLYAMRTDWGVHMGDELSQIALGVKEAVQVSKLAAPGVLGIPTNQIPGAAGPAKLLMARKGQGSFRLPGDSMDITIVGPTTSELTKLREGWNHWLTDHQHDLKKIDAQIKAHMRDLASGAASPALTWQGQPDYKGVTVPNIASLVLFVEEAGKTLLLTGDAQHDLLLEHLKAAGLLQAGHRHLTCLKVQHHGATDNYSAEFAQTISADHYVFCGNGEHGNPEPKVLQWIFDSRMSADPKIRALAPEARDARPFHFWFSTTSDVALNNPGARADFKVREALVAKLKAKSKGRLKTHYNKTAKLTLAL